jgi:hypothetical protein
MVGQFPGQLPDAGDHRGVRGGVDANRRQERRVRGSGAAGPQDDHVDPARRAVDRHGHGGHRQTQQSFAVNRQGRFRAPQTRQIGGDPSNFLPFGGAQGHQVSPPHQRVFAVQRLQRAQRRVPAPFQLPGDQAVIRVNGIILALCQRHVIAGTLQA